MSVVEPDIEPATVSEPFDVVTVQSPVCADGVPSSEFTMTISSVMLLFVMVIGSELNDDLVSFRMGCAISSAPILNVAEPSSMAR